MIDWISMLVGVLIFVGGFTAGVLLMLAIAAGRNRNSG